MPSSAFRSALADRQTDPEGRRWLFVAYDQLTDQLGPLARHPPEELGIVVVEAPAKAARRPYHVQKLALVLANLRHFALEQAARGVAVRHVVARTTYRAALAEQVRVLGPLQCMEPAERELRVELAPLVESGDLEVLPHEGWLTTREMFDAAHPEGSPWRMDRFYRHVRRETGILMANGKPVGGKLSFDADNRKPWRGEPAAPEPPRFRADEVTREVFDLVEANFADHPGTLDRETLPATHGDARALWNWAKDTCLAEFGPFQDAMATSSSSLFHTRISALLHLHRLLPSEVVADALDLDIPLASQEGFVRQILGWREFVRHVHVATDGFRDLDPDRAPETEAAGDAGYRSWLGRAWTRRSSASVGFGGACPAHLEADQPLPAAFWGTPSGLHCLDRVVTDVWREGYGHHITRLMVLANLATLLDVSPRELTDWFWVAYTDAYDWVVEPNVLGMGTFAIGDRMTTKPYIAGSAYIHRMSDYCKDCAFHPARTCPIRSLYWAFLDRHRETLAGNPRLSVPLASLDRRGDDRRRADRQVFETVASELRAGRTLTPRSFD